MIRHCLKPQVATPLTPNVDSKVHVLHTVSSVSSYSYLFNECFVVPKSTWMLNLSIVYWFVTYALWIRHANEHDTLV